jgi:hypothetical protein
VFVPFRVYAGVVRSRYAARIGIYWYRRETYTDSQGKTRTRTVRETEWFGLEGSAARAVEDHLVSASTGLPEAEANALEPFDLGWACAFDSRLIAGWECELPSVEREHANRIAAAELRDAEADRIEGSLLPGDRKNVEQIASEVEVDRCDITLLPVWMAAFEHRGRRFRLLVNGQTGACVGSVPRSAVKIAVAVILALVLVAVPVVLRLVGVLG